MAAKKAGSRSEAKTALCLSGGGFRASLFHLGVLTRLHETGLLRKVDTISSVSGGSILAGFLAFVLSRQSASGPSVWEELDWRTRVVEPFCRFVSRDMRTGLIARHLLWNWLYPEYRFRAMEDYYAKHLFAGESSFALGDLPDSPEFVFCATDLNHGINFVFTREYSGSYRTGKITRARNWSVARAVAASSAFPPLFGPLSLDLREDQIIELTDGGVYDNLGVEPVWKRGKREHKRIIISDAGAPLEFSRPNNYFSRLSRYLGVMSSQSFKLRSRMFYGWAREPGHLGAMIRITRNLERAKANESSAGFAGYDPATVNDYLASVRTDLDAFLESEQCILQNHGYHSACMVLGDSEFRKLAHDVPAKSPYPEWEDEERVRRVLMHGSARVSPRRLWRLMKERWSGGD